MTEQTQTSPLYPADGSPTELRGLPLLDAIIEHVQADPETWKQGTWARRSECGTALCVAGHAVVAAGYEPLFEHGWSYGGANVTEVCGLPGSDDTEFIGRLAAGLLGIENLVLRKEPDGDGWVEEVYADEDLFEGGNTLADLKRVRDEIAVKLGQAKRYAEATA